MRALLAIASLLVAQTALAAAAEANGYLDSRSQFTRARVGGVLPTKDLPQVQELLEANVQVRSRYADRGFVYGDVSLFGLFVGSYRDVDENGVEFAVPDHHPPGTDPLVTLSELYLSHDLTDELNVLVGKKRVIWGPGMAFNPTDLWNPLKDPTDPSFQRAGVYMGRFEVTLPTYTFTFLASPAVTEQANGIPFKFLTYPSWDQKDEELHYQLAARAYALIADSDLNLMVFYGNRYTEVEPFPDRLRVGVSFSRYFFTDYELHTEALFQQGTARPYANAVCMADVQALAGCLVRREPLSDRGRINEKTILPRVIVGGRRQFSDESLISVEYLYQADGYNRRQFEDYVRLLAFASRAPQFTAATNDPEARTNSGTPQKFTFLPLVKHYAFLTYQKPRIKDDWTLSATAIVNLQDLSGMLAPALGWQAEEWLQFSLSAFVPWPGPESLAARIPEVDLPLVGIHTPETFVSEYSLLPAEYRALLQVRLFY